MKEVPSRFLVDVDQGSPVASPDESLPDGARRPDSLDTKALHEDDGDAEPAGRGCVPRMPTWVSTQSRH